MRDVGEGDEPTMVVPVSHARRVVIYRYGVSWARSRYGDEDSPIA